MYEDFACIYDLLMSDVDYEKWSRFYETLISSYGSKISRICECACGTGSLTIPFYRHGYQVTGVDLSQDMLWQAAQKSRRMGIMIPFVRQDMRALNLHRPVDAVIASCDGVNYLTQNEDALSFFRCAYRSLVPGGVLAFDVSTPYKITHTLCGNGLICEDREELTYIWQNIWHEKTSTVSMDLVFFIKENDGRYRRIEESQIQRAYDAETLRQLLECAGFTDISFYGDLTMKKPSEAEQRWHITAYRP